MIKMHALRNIPNNTITDLKIISPQGTMFANPNENTVHVSEELKTAPNNWIEVSGNQLSIILDTTQQIEKNELQIIFEVSNPTNVPDDNTWMFEAWKNDRVLFTHVLEGYVYNQQSAYQVSAPKEQAKATPSTPKLTSLIISFLCLLL